MQGSGAQTKSDGPMALGNAERLCELEGFRTPGLSVSLSYRPLAISFRSHSLLPNLLQIY